VQKNVDEINTKSQATPNQYLDEKTFLQDLFFSANIFSFCFGPF